MFLKHTQIAPDRVSDLLRAAESAARAIPPAFPLTATVAVNPFLGQTGEDLARDYAAGNEIARAAVERSGRAIGRAIASATNLLDLDLVVIGGGFSKVTPDLFDFIRESVAERQTFPFVTRVKVVPSALTDDAPLLGAAALVHRPELLD